MKIKPCPICGGQLDNIGNDTWPWWWGECQDCEFSFGIEGYNLEGEIIGTFDTEADLIEAMNKRAGNDNED